MTNLIELSRQQCEQIVLDELDFLIDFELKLTTPDTELLNALRLVRGQFEPISIDV